MSRLLFIVYTVLVTIPPILTDNVQSDTWSKLVRTNAELLNSMMNSIHLQNIGQQLGKEFSVVASFWDSDSAQQLSETVVENLAEIDNAMQNSIANFGVSLITMIESFSYDFDRGALKFLNIVSNATYELQLRESRLRDNLQVQSKMISNLLQTVRSYLARTIFPKLNEVSDYSLSVLATKLVIRLVKIDLLVNSFVDQILLKVASLIQSMLTMLENTNTSLVQPSESHMRRLINDDLLGGTIGGVSGGVVGGVIGGAVGGITGTLMGALLDNTANALTGDLFQGSAGGITGGLAGGLSGGLIGGVTGGSLGGQVGSATGTLVGDLAGELLGTDTGVIVGGITGGLSGAAVGGAIGAVSGGVTGAAVGGNVGGVAGIVSGATGGLTGGLVGGAAGGLVGGAAGGLTGSLTNSLTSGFKRRRRRRNSINYTRI